MKSYIPDETERHAANRYHSYTQGWRDGASIRAMRTERSDVAEYNELYDEGYKDGMLARGDAHMTAQKRFGYKPSVLRTHEPVGKP